MKIFGPGAFAARLPSFLAALAMGAVLFWWGERRIGKGVGWWAMLIWCTNIHVFIEARSAVPEMILVLWQFLSFVLLVEGAGLTGLHLNKTKIILSWGCAALAVMAKGPVGILLPCLAAMVCAVWLKGWKELIRFIVRAWRNIGPVVFVAIVLPWYGAMAYMHGELFLQEFFYKNNLARFTGSIAYHPYSFWSVYIPVLAVGFWLWHPLWGKVFARLLGKDFPITSMIKAMVVWSATIIFFYGVAANKLHHYILASYPGLCLLIGQAAATSRGLSVGSKVVLAIQGIIEIGAAVFLWKYASTGLPISLKPLAAIMVVVGILTLLTAFKTYIKREFLLPWLQMFRAGAFLSVLLGAAYLYSGIYQPQIAGKYLSEAPSALYKRNQSAVIFYAQKRLPILENAGKVFSELSKKKVLRLWLRSSNSDSLLADLPKSVKHTVLWEGYDKDDRVQVVELRGGGE